MSKQVYIAVYAEIDADGKTTGFSIDTEALIGSYDGYVWDDDTEEWSNDGPTNDSYGLLSHVLEVINNTLDTAPEENA